MEEGIPIIDPSFYADEERCPDSLIEHVFRVVPQASEDIPLLPERVAIMREVGAVLCAVSIGFVAFLLQFKHIELLGRAAQILGFRWFIPGIRRGVPAPVRQQRHGATTRADGDGYVPVLPG